MQTATLIEIAPDLSGAVLLLLLYLIRKKLAQSRMYIHFITAWTYFPFEIAILRADTFPFQTPVKRYQLHAALFQSKKHRNHYKQNIVC